jgi:hypothetical protein
MAIWMEMRCDGNTSSRCYSGQNNGPMHLSSSFNRGKVTETLILIEKEAKEQGWRRVSTPKGYNWLCPECKKERT